MDFVSGAGVGVGANVHADFEMGVHLGVVLGEDGAVAISAVVGVDGVANMFSKCYLDIIS